MDRRAHIVHIIPTLRYGGAERLVVDLVNHLDEKLYRTSIILFFDDCPLATLLHHKQIHIVRKRGKLSFSLIGDLEKKLHELKPDIVHTHLFGGDVWGRLAAHRLNIPVLTTEHNINIEESGVKHVVKQLLRHKTTQYIAISRAVAAYMERGYGIAPEHISVIHNGIDTQAFLDIPRPYFHNPLRFLIIGRLVKQKGHLIALEALSRMKQFDWKLTIVGDGEEKRTIWDMVYQLGLQDRVMVLPSTTNTPAVYAAHDIVIVPSLWEGLGLVVMEAMAAGRLVIAANIGGIPELIQDKLTGVLFHAGDPISLRTELGWCLHSPDHARTIAHAGRAHAAQYFDVSLMIKQYEAVYQNILLQL
jgi:glycosyltransferase involved in cell wall biosynthesis